MELTFIVFLVVVVVCASAILISVLYILIKSIRSGRRREDATPAIKSFLSAEDNSKNFGSDFVQLIKLGFFSTPRAVNHSKDFNDKTHLKNFRKNLTPENSLALREIGDIYEQHYI